MVVARDLAERKRLLLEKADAVVIMVGGTGTLDEATEILELKKHGHTTSRSCCSTRRASTTA